MKEITFRLPDELANKFELAMQLTGANKDAVGEEFIRSYLAKALQSAADEFRVPEAPKPQVNSQPQPNANANVNQTQNARPQPNPGVRADSAAQAQKTQQSQQQFNQTRTNASQQNDPRSVWTEWGKAINRIPRWARNPQQNNHKILRAFFELKQELGNVTIDALRRRCSDPNEHPNTYVPHFDNNFSQMKFDNGNSHGKVFEEHDGYVTIWDRISDTLQKYRDFFE